MGVPLVRGVPRDNPKRSWGLSISSLTPGLCIKLKAWWAARPLLAEQEDQQEDQQEEATEGEMGSGAGNDVAELPGATAAAPADGVLPMGLQDRRAALAAIVRTG